MTETTQEAKIPQLEAYEAGYDWARILKTHKQAREKAEKYPTQKPHFMRGWEQHRVYLDGEE